MYAAIQKEITKDNEAFLTPAFESYKKSNPQFKLLKSTLTSSPIIKLYSHQLTPWNFRWWWLFQRQPVGFPKIT